MLLKQYLNSFLSYKLNPERTVAEEQKSDSCYPMGKLLNCPASWANEVSIIEVTLRVVAMEMK